MSDPQKNYPVCPTCGAAATGAAICTHCGANLTGQRQLPSRETWEYWEQMREYNRQQDAIKAAAKSARNQRWLAWLKTGRGIAAATAATGAIVGLIILAVTIIPVGPDIDPYELEFALAEAASGDTFKLESSHCEPETFLSTANFKCSYHYNVKGTIFDASEHFDVHVEDDGCWTATNTKHSKFASGDDESGCL